MAHTKVKIGFLGVGLHTYWQQFEGLLPRLLSYQNRIGARIGGMEAEVVDAGMVDTPEKAQAAALMLKQGEAEAVFICITTYSLSSTILPVVQQVGKPVILLNIQAEPAINYRAVNSMADRGKMTGEWLACCQACSVPELAHILNRAGIRYDIVTGYFSEDFVWKQVRAWIDAIRAVRGMRNNRLGILGHYYCGMLDVYSDVTLLNVVFGGQVEYLEMDELNTLHSEVTGKELKEKLNEFSTLFEVLPSCEPGELARAARTSAALDRLVESHGLGSLAYYYEGYRENEARNIVTSVIAGTTLLTGRGIPVAGECEVKNALAMKMLSLLDAGGSFAEFYALDFTDDVVLLGHDGPAHHAISEGKVRLVPLPVYHGKPGKGLSIQMRVRKGDVTLLSVCEGSGGVFLLIAEGESDEGETLHIGNTNSRYRFPCGVRRFIDRWSKAGPSHHCAIGVGHKADELKKAAFLLGIPAVVVE